MPPDAHRYTSLRVAIGIPAYATEALSYLCATNARLAQALAAHRQTLQTRGIVHDPI